MVRKLVLRVVAVLVALIIVAVAFLFFKNRALMSEIRARLQEESKLAATPWGNIEYAVEGNGPPILLVHATGGGYDQGLLLGNRKKIAAAIDSMFATTLSQEAPLQ